MKHLKLFEELTFSPKKIFYTKDEGESTILYSFDYDEYSFLVEFTKCYLLKDNTISMEKVDDYLSELWRRDFHTVEEGFGTLNISARSAIDIYSYVAKITEDFLNEYNPDILMMTHTSKSRFNINWKFMENLNISKDYLIKAINTFSLSSKTVLIKKNVSNLIEYIK
jgi:hypothetical protein